MNDLLNKTNRINLLFDFYGSMLTEKQQKYLSYYFHEDYSLGEISTEFQVSRQAIFEHIKRAEQSLEEMEQKLHLLAQHEYRLLQGEKLKSWFAKHDAPLADADLDRFIDQLIHGKDVQIEIYDD